MVRITLARERTGSKLLPGILPRTKPAPFPSFIEPCLAALRTKVPAGVGFVHEVTHEPATRVNAHFARDESACALARIAGNCACITTRIIVTRPLTRPCHDAHSRQRIKAHVHAA